MRNFMRKNGILLLISVCFLFVFVFLLVMGYPSAAKSSEYIAPQITGQTKLVLDEGYEDTETSAYTIKGTDVDVSIVSDTTGGRAVWNDQTKKLTIQAGLTSNASVTLEVSNGIAAENAAITLYITICKDPSITGPTECFLEVGYEATSSRAFTVHGKDVSVSIADESSTGLITWNAEAKKVEVAPGLKIGTYKVILTASNGNAVFDSTWEYVITVGKRCVVTGRYAYSAGTYKNNALVNVDDKVTVKVGNYIAKVDPNTRTYEVVVPNGTYNITLTSEKFRAVKLADVEITNNKKIADATFAVPLLTPTAYFGYGAVAGYNYTVWKGQTVSIAGVKAEEGFVLSVKMKPEWPYTFRGMVGFTVKDKTFYIKPAYENKTASIYVGTGLGEDVKSSDKKVASTGQTVAKMNLPCTLKVVYLDGNYYASLKVDGCDAEEEMILINAQTSGLDAEYFAAGERTIWLGAFTNGMGNYDGLSYELGDEAAKKALGDMKLCTVKGSFAYASGTYQNQTYQNEDDKVTVRIGGYTVKADQKSQTYEMVVPSGTYDITLTSSQFQSVKIPNVEITEAKEVEKATFVKPRLTPTTYFGYNAVAGYNYTVWKDRTVSIAGVKAEEGFVLSVKMKPEWPYTFRGMVGFTVKDKTFYIKPAYENKTASIYVGTGLGEDVKSSDKKVASTGQTVEKMNLPCTLKVVYLDGNYYASLKVDGCDAEEEMILINAQTSGLDADYFTAGERTICLGSFINGMGNYDGLSYELGDEAAKKALGDVKLCTVTGSYAYASGTYQDQTYQNADDKVTVQIGGYTVKADQKSQTYEMVVPSGTYDIMLTSSQFQNVKIPNVEIKGTKEVEKATFVKPRLTPTTYFGYNAVAGYNYTVWKDRTVSIAGVKAEEGFVLSVKMQPEWPYTFRGMVGFTVKDKTFYIKPAYGNGTASIYVGTGLGEAIGSSDKKVGSTGQTVAKMNLPCTLKVVYLDGNYYASLKVDGCDAEEELLLINAQTSGLDADYFTAGERTICLGAFPNGMCNYDGLSYELGDEAAKKALGDVKLCTVKGSYAYASGTYQDQTYRNAEDKVTVKIGSYTAVVDQSTQTYEMVVPSGTYDITLSSSQFQSVKIPNVEITETKEVEKATFVKPNLTPTTDFGYGADGHDYGVWNGKSVSVAGMKANEGFVATVKMKPYDAIFGRGAFGVTVNGKTFYIKPYYGGGKTSIYIGTEVGKGNQNPISGTNVGLTEQTYKTKNEPCTLKVIYLDGTYYVSLKVEGCEAEPKMLLINAQTSGFDAEYFAAGERTFRLGAFTDNMVYYDGLSYELGNEAAEKALSDMNLCVVKGSYAYASGTYQDQTYRNAEDTVTVKIGGYTAVADQNTQTYQAIVPSGTYDITLTSSQFLSVKIPNVEITETKEVEKATFVKPNLTPTADRACNVDGHDYAVWAGKSVSVAGMKTNEGFVATVEMKPYDGIGNRGAFGVTVNGKTFYIKPFYSRGKASIYVGTGLSTWDTASGTNVGSAVETGANKLNPCTLKVIYLDGTYYVSLKAEGWDTEPKMLKINAQTSGLDAEYFAAGERTIRLGAVTNDMVYYDGLHYELGDEAAKKALGDVKLSAVKGSYAYASGTYRNRTYKLEIK